MRLAALLAFLLALARERPSGRGGRACSTASRKPGPSTSAIARMPRRSPTWTRTGSRPATRCWSARRWPRASRASSASTPLTIDWRAGHRHRPVRCGGRAARSTCSAARRPITLTRREQVDFSLPTFVDGAAVMLPRRRRAGVRRARRQEDRRPRRHHHRGDPAANAEGQGDAGRGGDLRQPRRRRSRRWRRARSTPTSATSRSSSGSSSPATSPSRWSSRTTP